MTLVDLKGEAVGAPRSAYDDLGSANRGPLGQAAAGRSSAVQGLVFLAGILLVLFLTKSTSYILFHTLAELFTVIIAAVVFVVAWNARRRHDESYLTFLGIACLFVAGLDLLHALTYRGMQILPPNGSNLPTQLWIAARYLESCSLLALPFVIGRRVRLWLIFAGFSIAFVTLLLSLFTWDVFPACFIEGTGLTPFKRTSEYLICIILLAAFGSLYVRRGLLDSRVFGLLLAVIGLKVAQEICFTLYDDPYAAWNFAGHCLKIVTFFLIYKVIVETGIGRPYDLLFVGLRKSEQLAHQQAADLHAANRRLEMAQQAGGVGTFEWNVSSQQAFLVQVPGRMTESAGHRQCHVHPEDAPLVEQAMQDAIKGLHEYQVECRILWPDGSTHWVAARGSIVSDSDGNPKKMIGVTIDITARKEAELALKRANQVKDHFLATLSHELRTPLSPILTAAQLIERSADASPAVKNFGSIIIRNLGLEARLIDDLLDITRITSGKLSLTLCRLDVHDSVRQCLETCRAQIDQKKHDVRLQLEAATVSLQADATRLMQILWNLLNNAVKFTPPHGCITIRTSNPTHDTIQIAVADNGVGVDPSMLPRLFRAFEQADPLEGQRLGGLGLGLAISHRLAELHRGSLVGESQGNNTGSTFTLTLPLRDLQGAQADEANRSHSDESSERLKILLVEDQEDSALLMKAALEAEGHEVATAYTVAAALNVGHSEKFDILVSDIALPDGSGFDVMRALGETSNIRGIALTGYGMEDDIRRCLEAGFMAHLTKPADLDALLRVIRDACSRPAEVLV